MSHEFKVLFVTSFYSALRASVESGKWQPTGMPAIVKLLEGFKKNGLFFHVVLIDKSGIYPRTPNKVIFKEFSANFYICASQKYLIRFAQRPVLSKFTRSINALFHFVRICRIVKQVKIDIIYTDRENVVMGAIFALLGNKVVLRLHGVLLFYDMFDNFLTRFRYPLRFLSFKAPFQYIICSEDGTPAKEFLERFTSTAVPKSVRLNGVDKFFVASTKIRREFGIPQNQPIILFVGRMDEGKGAEIFVHCLKKLNSDFSALIVGEGKLYDELKSQTQGHPNLILTGSIKHEKIQSFYEAADIYVSLNSLGNLSNTVLEALQAGNCIVTYKGDKFSLRDRSTERYLKGAAVFIDRYKVLDELPNKLNELLNSPEKIYQLKKKAKRLANKILKTWEQRTNEEICIINDACCRDYLSI